MKPRNRFEKAVTASNMKLSTVSPKAVEWAVRNTVSHIAFRTSGHKCTCGDCGHKFDYKGKGKYTRCPQCRHKLEVTDTLTRKRKESVYFSTIERVDGFHVQRVFRLSAITRKGKKKETWQMEVCRIWLNKDGKTAVTSRTRMLGHYMDCFNWLSDIELRNLTNVHWVISNTYVYPNYSTTRELRRNGMRGQLPDCHPTRLAQMLLEDSRIETMIKAKDFKAVEYFTAHEMELDRCWQSYKIAKRNRYEPEDYGLWCDTIRLLERCASARKTSKLTMTNGLQKPHAWRKGGGIWNGWRGQKDRRRTSTRKSPVTSGLSSATMTLKYPCLTLWRLSKPREAVFTIACSNASITRKRIALSYRHTTAKATASRPWSSR